MTYGDHLLDMVHYHALDFYREAEKRRLIKSLPPSQPRRLFAFFKPWRASAQIEEGQYDGRTRRKLMAVR